jgi:hypothetical protein
MLMPNTQCFTKCRWAVKTCEVLFLLTVYSWSIALATDYYLRPAHLFIVHSSAAAAGLAAALVAAFAVAFGAAAAAAGWPQPRSLLAFLARASKKGVASVCARICV